MLFRSKKCEVSVGLARGALEGIYDECDRFEVDETGGRIIGTYKQDGGRYDIQVAGVIGPGPNADRSPTSFFQDGEYQERMFRLIEARHPKIEHLGNWHTHHVNGYPTLSNGDKATYFRTVNHDNHNTDFFYALLVVRKNAGRSPRYDIKHFFFQRNDNTVYEIPDSHVRVIEAAALTVGDAAEAFGGSADRVCEGDLPNPERAKDQEFFSEFHPDLKPLLSRTTGAPYWKGTIELIDGTRALIASAENGARGEPYYSIAASGDNPIFAPVIATLKNRQFPSARHAVIELERAFNRVLFHQRGGASS